MEGTTAMVTPSKFVEALNENKLGPLIGVPCTVLAPLVNYVLDNPSDIGYLNPANEAHALAWATGFYLGTKKIPVVFLQNSGLGNIVNPLTSLNQIYRVPAFLIITWRGFGGPGSDAPEHNIMGSDLEDYLRVFHLPYKILSENGYPDEMAGLIDIACNEEIPVAAIIKKDFFDAYKPPVKTKTGNGFQKYEAIRIIKESLDGFILLSTTGFISRESFAIKDSPDFYMVGSMGLISAIGCGVALARKGDRIAILDGDGAILMHLGLIPFIGSLRPKNLFHIILDNEVYASTQNQPTVSPSIQFDKIALASGYRQAYKVSSAGELKDLLESIKDSEGPNLVWVKIAPGNKEGVGRVLISPEEIRNNFMQAIQER